MMAELSSTKAVVAACLLTGDRGLNTGAEPVFICTLITHDHHSVQYRTALALSEDSAHREFPSVCAVKS